MQFRQLRGIPIGLLQLDSLLHAIIRSEGALEHGCGCGGILSLKLRVLIGNVGEIERVTKRVSGMRIDAQND